MVDEDQPQQQRRCSAEEGGASTTRTATAELQAEDATKLPELIFTFRPLQPVLYFCFLVICNVVIPCLLYYLLRIYTHLDDKELIGIGSAALGLSSCFDAPFRLYKLIKYHDKYGPLNDCKWWHLDFFSHLYTIALLVFAVPLAVAPAVPLYNFFLFSSAMFVSPIMIIFLLSLKPWKFSFPISSDVAGTPTKPAVFYLLEDVVAVDFAHGREWRRQMYARYEASPLFRRLMRHLTIYWSIMCLIFVGATSAVTWSLELDISFGLVLGDFFLWLIVSAIGCYYITVWGLRKEWRLWGTLDEVKLRVEEGQAATMREKGDSGRPVTTPRWVPSPTLNEATVDRDGAKELEKDEDGDVQTRVDRAGSSSGSSDTR
ncbi:hypothetical protein T439DRAFT_327449 [Meredithblackwellia eburnea MCA 4105]